MKELVRIEGLQKKFGKFTALKDVSFLVVLCAVAMIMPISVINRLFTEESTGRLSRIYATKTSRGRVYCMSVVIAAVAAAIALVVSACGLGGAAVSVMTIQEIEFIDFIKAGLNYFPAALFMISVAGMILGWLEKTAIFSFIPRMPVDEFDGVVFAGITGISIVLLFLGYVGYKKRDLN